MNTRRTFLGAAALAPAGFASSAAKGGGAPNLPGQFKLGVASYSLRKFPRDKAIQMIKALNVDIVSIKDFHLAFQTPAAERLAGADEFRKAGIEVVSGGVIQMRDEKLLRDQFQYAKDAGMPMMIIMPQASLVPQVEALVKEFNIRVAIHNHGPEDKNFPSCLDILKAIKGMDPRVGICCDIGHETRTGTDVLAVVSACGSRLLDVHCKDLGNAKEAKSQVAVGDGILPVAALFKLLKKMKYTGNVNLEYEIFPDDPLPGMQKSLAYMRGVLAGLRA